MLTQDLRANFWNGMTPSERLGYINHVENLYNVKIGHSNSEKTFKYIMNKELLKALDLDTNKVPLTFSETPNRGKITRPSQITANRKQFFKETRTEVVDEIAVLNKVKAIIGKCLHFDEGFLISNTANIEGDLGADSLDFVEIIMEVEKEFDLIVPDSTAGKLKTVTLLANYVSLILGVGETRERPTYGKPQKIYLGYRA